MKIKGGAMNRRSLVFLVSLFVLAPLTGLELTRAQTGGKADVVAAITKLENDGVKADLANDAAFYQKLMAEDWTGGDSDGTWFTKAQVLKMMADTKNNKTNSEKLSELKVRVYGNAAVATYKDTYDALFNGEHRTRTVIATDTFVKMGGEWKEVASHSSTAK
jgi:ketosteroid isomerase-like protein